MDAALTAVISAALGGAVTASGGWLRQRYGARTAARLVYAELTGNTAPILYYRHTGSWPANPVVDTAWKDSSKDLARAGDADDFDAIYRGYGALLALGYLLAHEEMPQDERDAIFDSSVHEVVAALRISGRIARIRRSKIEERVALMQPPPAMLAAPGDARFAQADAVIPAALLEEIARRGTPGQRSSAASTISDAAPHAPAPVSQSWNRVVFDAGHGTDITAAAVARREGAGPTGDPAVDEAYDALGAAARFYREVFGRDLLSFRERPLVAVVHYGVSYLNCFWDGSRVIVGDGDDQLMRRFTIAPDVIANELSRELMKATQLRSDRQPGALLISLGDVFGILTRQYARGEKDAASAGWVVGEGVLVNGRGLRSLEAPGTAYDDPTLGTDSQVAHMDDYVADVPDEKWRNGGIPNHAFYLAATALPGPAWERAGRVWYAAALSGRLRPTSGFASFAALTIAEARASYGDESAEAEAVRQAWRQVGVKPRAPAQSPVAAAAT